MARNKNKKRKLAKKQQQQHLEKAPVVGKDSDSDSEDSLSESELESGKIQKILEPYTKDQLIEFICDAAVKDSVILQSIRSTADRDISHRKIFVHGLAWDTTSESLTAAFKTYGEIEDLKVVTDRVTGKAKGYGFVIFKTRAGAKKALKQPQKKINNRVTSCQLASIGPIPAVQNQQDTTGRKIYVSNVNFDADPEKLRSFFAKFGEIEMGPMGFDVLTGKPRGFALFLYKTQAGAKKALEEPYKMFEGHQLHCHRASETKNKPANAMQLPVQTPLAAVAAAQNLALFSQHPTLNPMYSGLVGHPNAGLLGHPNAGLVGHQNAGLLAGPVNPLMASALNPVAIPSSQVAGGSLGNAMGMGGYGASHGQLPEGTIRLRGLFLVIHLRVDEVQLS
ncbi:hypothetical protein NE237_018882 [Protea cynaroides]|uniref:RRM domain-containing protein n=1 Tax=Protea cynaroides TaxID=273540 RepID=A0A9Q0QPG1_9MAGN|nr:hypothetical protein NE237_018882 [Protea cynaroides]